VAKHLKFAYFFQPWELLLLLLLPVLQMTYVDLWMYFAKTRSPLRTLSVLGKVTRLIIILCKFHIVHLGYVRLFLNLNS
jgi:hypothetical protein